MRRPFPCISALVLTLCVSIASALAATPTRLSEVTGVEQAAFSASGAQVVINTKDDTITLWNAANGSPIAGEINGPGLALLMSDTAHQVLVSHPQGGARIFDPTTGAARSPQLDVRLRVPAHPEAVFTPEDGPQILIFEPRGAVAIFEIATGKRVATLSLRAQPDKKDAGSTKNAQTKPGEKAAAEAPAEEEEDAEPAPSAHFTRDGARCYVMSVQGVVTGYDTATWKPLGAPMRHTAAPSAYTFGMALSDDAHWMATFDDPGENGPKGHLQIWDLSKGHPVGKPAVAVNGMSGTFVPHTARLLVTPGRGEASIRDLPAYKKTCTIPAHDEVDGPSVALSPDGQWALSWGSDRILRLQATDTGAVQESEVFQAKVTQVLMLPDSRGCLVVFDNSSFSLQLHFDCYVLKLSFPDLRIEQSLRTTEDLRHVALAPNGANFLLQSDNPSSPDNQERVHVYDVNDFKKLAD